MQFETKLCEIEPIHGHDALIDTQQTTWYTTKKPRFQKKNKKKFTNTLVKFSLIHR